MNISNKISKLMSENVGDNEIAQKYLKSRYAGIEYIEDSDSFKYRGRTFDYFKSACWTEEKTGKRTYNFCLADQETGIWLFDFDNQEDRWKNFIIKVQSTKLNSTVLPDPIKTYVSGWNIEYRCVRCQKVLSNNQVMYSHGLCPHCGYKSSDACTIVDNTEHFYRLVRYGKWWQFWIRPVREYKNV